jgi:hypothetical protein
MKRKRRNPMKKQILTVAAALVFTALVPAQSRAQQVTQAKIPFAFQVENTKMPAGEYQIRRALPSSKAVLQIRRTDSAAAMFVLTNSADTRSNDAELIFHCYGNECFLSEIRTGRGQALKLGLSRGEKEVSHANGENELAVLSLPLTVTP